jgi:opacity protein-like surface antigen
LIPQVGLYAPVTDLGTVGTGAAAVEVAKKEGTFGLGLALELGNTDATSFRVNAMYGTSSDIPVTRIGCANCQARSTVAGLTGSVVVRPLPNIIAVRPYLQGGLGLKRYDFDEDDLRAEGLDAFLNDQNKLTGQLGIGAELNLPLFRVFLEISDFISGFDLGSGANEEAGEMQHDFFISVGLPLGG